ncbi:LOW QUALITY PROTEIN: Non-hem dioxygenase N-terminal domain [Dillenia turbinata]|uniref:Non-hem dioxygenase N-terminal domain n=1 Tax=Dillenia turbinata TaxID=194707 RepID=A0AAN8VPC7_9MAGN
MEAITMNLTEYPTIKPAEQYNRENEVRKFDETKAGVKGQIDSGIEKIPKMFIHSPETLQSQAFDRGSLDLQVRSTRHSSGRQREIVHQICKASDTWGLFQIVNHGGLTSVMKDMLESVQQFHMSNLRR